MYLGVCKFTTPPMNRVNEVILENGGNRKPVFYGQVPVKVIETLNYYKI